MENKIYKNKNMIRETHRVSRVVCFDNELELVRFMDLYKDMMGKVYGTGFENRISLGFTINKDDFDNIVKVLGLTNIKTKRHKTKYWEFGRA